MKLKFSKMHGCGNDYIYFNCLENEIEHPNELAKILTHRRFSIGGDGIVLICKSQVANFKMRMFNIDGSEGKMCGNAIRCVAKLVFDRGLIKNTIIKIETLSGIKTVEVKLQNGKVTEATVDMGAPKLNPSEIFISEPVNGPLISYPFKIDDEIYKITCVSMGNPHCVIFVDNLNSVNLSQIGPKFEKNSFFDQGVNTEFVKIRNQTEIDMKVWERGSGQTLACGTGASASVVAANLNGFCKKGTPVKVNLEGGSLIVCETDDTVFLTGEAILAFEGTVEI